MTRQDRHFLWIFIVDLVGFWFYSLAGFYYGDNSAESLELKSKSVKLWSPLAAVGFHKFKN